MIYVSNYNSPIDNIVIKATETHLTNLYFDDNVRCDNNLDSNNIIKITKSWLDIYFSGRMPDFTPPICYQATLFSKSVYDYIINIPFGNVTTYGEIAKHIAKKNNKHKISSQAVGNALSKNPILLIIPCHRVISSAGKISGYVASVERKKYLLNLENSLHNIKP